MIRERFPQVVENVSAVDGVVLAEVVVDAGDNLIFLDGCNGGRGEIVTGFIGKVKYLAM